MKEEIPFLTVSLRSRAFSNANIGVGILGNDHTYVVETIDRHNVAALHGV